MIVVPELSTQKPPVAMVSAVEATVSSKVYDVEVVQVNENKEEKTATSLKGKIYFNNSLNLLLTVIFRL